MSIKTVILCLLAVISYHFLSKFCIKQTDGFTVARIHSALLYNPAWENPPLSQEERNLFQQALNQPFSYLGCGGQCFAFVSQDDAYVIKLFKHKIRKPFMWFQSLFTRKWNKILYKLNRDFSSYTIAYSDLQEETGVLYTHLNKSQDWNLTITIKDKLGITHPIALNNVEFILQKKAVMAYDYIEKCMHEKDLAKAQRAIDSILEVIVSRCQKGIFDEDARIHRNFGFIDDKAVVIDIGRFKKDPSRQNPEVYRKDLSAISHRFQLWLDENFPELVPHLKERLQHETP